MNHIRACPRCLYEVEIDTDPDGCRDPECPFLYTEEIIEENARLKDKLRQIKTWVSAYPLDVFPEPDFKRARKVLEAAGMTLDAISASNMRHVLNRIMNFIETKEKKS